MTDRSPDRLPEEVNPGRLSRAQIDALLELRLIAKLATVEGGLPHVVAMWFRRDGDRILMPTSRHTRKARNLRASPLAAVLVDDSRAGLELSGVLIRGAVQLIEGPEARELNRSIHRRYVTERGLDQPEVAGYLSAGDDLTIAVQMDKTVSWNLAGREAGRALARTGEFHQLDG
jgi:nitroimidazol reductase NimA-like FMN-containing flavoprotein (pyridoxamine 5'-phosphate oxidase superfamily)